MKKALINNSDLTHLIGKQKSSTSNRSWTVIAVIVFIAFAAIVWMTGNRKVPTAIPQESILDRTDVQTSVPSIKEFSGFLLGAKTTDVPKTFQFEYLNFEPGSATPLQGSDDEFDQITASLEKYPLATIRIEGFSDSGGDITKNKDLAYRRAVAVEEQLVSRGVNPDRIDTVGNASGNKRVALIVTSVE